MQIVATETEVGALEEEVSKAGQVADLEKEINLFKVYLEEERRLEDGAISKDQFAMEKASNYFSELVKSWEADKRSLEDAHNGEKKASTLAKEKDATIKKMKATLQR